MNERSWKGYVAATCGAVWGLDTRATGEVIRCIEDIIAAEGIADSAAVQVFISVGPRGLGAHRSAMIVRVRAPAEASA